MKLTKIPNYSSPCRRELGLVGWPWGAGDDGAATGCALLCRRRRSFGRSRSVESGGGGDAMTVTDEGGCGGDAHSGGDSGAAEAAVAGWEQIWQCISRFLCA
ncbi:5'-3' exonuclease family protein [Striga asiatica]|uniref:5'-3' exonuclease family protein n=1 Tax=Striga asiatica TaxID=4170 RepID=A0A5A7QKW5_STRAF|nr:5'-3' exonuclease family protein [Striga asiatica]